MKRFFKVAISLCMLLFMGVIVSACSLFGGSYKVTEQEWNSALSYTGKRVVSTVTTGQYATSATTYIDGNKVKVQSVYNGEIQVGYLEYDGTAYWSYFLSNNVWQKSQIDKNEFDEIVGNFPNNSFPYEEFIFDSNKNAYYSEDLRTLESVFDVTIRFKDGKLTEIYVEQMGFSSKNTYSYENFTITIPTPGTEYDKDAEENGGEQPGQGGEEQPGQGGQEQADKRVTASEWQSALNPQGKYKMTQTGSMYGMQVSAVTYVDVNKIKMESSYLGETYLLKYFEIDNEGVWEYSSNPDSGVWSKQRISKIDYEASIDDGLESLNFDEFSYNQETGKYEMGDSTGSITLEFLNKKLVSFSVQADGINTTTSYDYSDNFTVTFPEVDPENIFDSEDDDDEWKDQEEQGYEVTSTEWSNAMIIDGEHQIYVTIAEGSTIYDISLKSFNVQIQDGIVEYGFDEYYYFDGIKYWMYQQDSLGDWFRTEIEKELYDTIKTDTIRKNLSIYDFTFDSASGYYVAQNLTISIIGQDVTINTVKVKFGEDKKLLEIYLESDSKTQKYKYGYDELWFDLELPEINN